MSKKSLLSACALALLAGAPLGAAQISAIPRPLTSGARVSSAPTGTAVFQVSNFNFQHAMLFNLVNSAIQNNGAIENFNGGPNAGILSATIRNVGTAAGYCYVIPIVEQGGNGEYNCTSTATVSQMTAATGPLLQTTTEIQPGQTLQANVGNFELVSGGGYSGAFCIQLMNLVSNNFGGNSINSNNNNGNNNNNNGNNNNSSGSGGSGGASSVLSALPGVVHELQQLQLSACLLVTSSKGVPISGPGGESCIQQPIGVFSPPPSVTTASGLLVYPNDTTIATELPTFIWTPSLYNGTSIGLQYELVLSQSQNGTPWYSVQIPSGQTFYRYQATDRVLQKGQKYYWHVTTLGAAGQSVGGENGQGWNSQDWFTCQPMGATGAGAALVSLSEIGALIHQNASPAVLKALAGMQIQSASPMGALADPDVAALVAKPTEIKTISVEKF